MNNYLFKSLLSVTIVLMLTCFVTQNAHAQTRDSLVKVYDNETIHSFGKYYIKGSKHLKFRDLKPEFNSDITKNLYKKSQGNLTMGRVFTITSIAAVATSAIVKKNNNGAGIALSIVGIGLNLGSKHFHKKSTELVDEAIWQRNREILFGVQ